MALTAGSVALLAVIVKSRSQWRTLFQVASSGFKSGLKAAERGMEANRIRMGNIFMAGIAITLRRVSHQTRMGQLFFTVPAVAAMADDTAYLTVGTLQEIGILDEDLFPYLQRRQFTASAFARCCR